MTRPTTYDEYLRAANDGWLAQHEQRRGQFFYNLLVEWRPDIAETVLSTALDPFHDDSRIPEFLDHVEARWSA